MRLLFSIVSLLVMACVPELSTKDAPCPCFKGFVCCDNRCIPESKSCYLVGDSGGGVQFDAAGQQQDTGALDSSKADVVSTDVLWDAGRADRAVPDVFVDTATADLATFDAVQIDTAPRQDAGPDCRNEPCQGMTYCDEATWRCSPGCGGDLQCDNGTTCNLDLHRCICPCGSRPCGSSCCPWQLQEVVDLCGYTEPSIDIDSAGRPHIAFFGSCADTLEYATVSGSGWHIQTVESPASTSTETGRGVSMVLLQDQPLFSYCAYGDEGGIKFAQRQGDDWQVTMVNQTHVTFLHSSLALDGDGYPHISYETGSFGGLHFSQYHGTQWLTEGLGPSYTGVYSSLALDGQGYPHILHHNYDTGMLIYTHWTGSDWNHEDVVLCERVAKVSLALDGLGQPHISFAKGTSADTGLRYGKKDGSKWRIQPVDPAGFHSMLVLDGSDLPHISYTDYQERYQKYARFTGTEWLYSNIVCDVALGDFAMALDDQDQPHIAYDNLWYAH